jgi:cytochrome c peroxidase
MRKCRVSWFVLVLVAVSTAVDAVAGNAEIRIVDGEGQLITLEAGHPSLLKWQLPATPSYAPDNAPTPERIALGKMLFFDPRLSGDGHMSCATCHNPLLGWADGLPTGIGLKGVVLNRASPTVFNVAYNSILMWDGRSKTMEDQVMRPMDATNEMNVDRHNLLEWLNGHAGYRALFQQAYPGRPIDAEILSMAITSFERTVISNHSPFDRWVAGEKSAMSHDQIKGFALFIDPGKGNCANCHSGPNFTDNGFHNLGLASFGKANPDLGRYALRPVAAARGAFKTPTVREAANTAPYFHDGSARTLEAVVEFYARGGVVRTNQSVDIKELVLDKAEKAQIVSFIRALSSPAKPFEMPLLPR